MGAGRGHVLEGVGTLGGGQLNVQIGHRIIAAVFLQQGVHVHGGGGVGQGGVVEGPGLLRRQQYLVGAAHPAVHHAAGEVGAPVLPAIHDAAQPQLRVVHQLAQGGFQGVVLDAVAIAAGEGLAVLQGVGDVEILGVPAVVPVVVISAVDEQGVEGDGVGNGLGVLGVEAVNDAAGNPHVMHVLRLRQPPLVAGGVQTDDGGDEDEDGRQDGQADPGFAMPDLIALLQQHLHRAVGHRAHDDLPQHQADAVGAVTGDEGEHQRADGQAAGHGDDVAHDGPQPGEHDGAARRLAVAQAVEEPRQGQQHHACRGVDPHGVQPAAGQHADEVHIAVGGGFRLGGLHQLHHRGTPVGEFGDLVLVHAGEALVKGPGHHVQQQPVGQHHEVDAHVDHGQPQQPAGDGGAAGRQGEEEELLQLQAQ